ncbi:helix-turn-helix domain-containing protein, partial [Klebsiella pneumoniae]|uniref:helix-turn-helix domain-containing protein n=1 Tax=Klebsiella pneumoniae TaxID=573 RepID=UPI003AF54B83
LTLENRIYIQNELDKGTSFKDIARFLCKDTTTISKEVKAHRLSDWYHKGTFYNAHSCSGTMTSADFSWQALLHDGECFIVFAMS